MICYAIKNTKFGGYLRKMNMFHPEPEFDKNINQNTIINACRNDLKEFIKIYNITDCKVVKVVIKEVEE